MILLPAVGEQELRSSSNLIFHQVENDRAMDREVILMEHERVWYFLTNVWTITRSTGRRDSLLNGRKMWVDFRILENPSSRRTVFLWSRHLLFVVIL